MRWSLFACRDDWGVDGAGIAVVVVDGDGGKVVVAVAGDVGRAGDGRRAETETGSGSAISHMTSRPSWRLTTSWRLVRRWPLFVRTHPTANNVCFDYPHMSYPLSPSGRPILLHFAVANTKRNGGHRVPYSSLHAQNKPHFGVRISHSCFSE